MSGASADREGIAEKTGAGAAPRRDSGGDGGVTLDVMGGVDATDDMATGIPATEATEVEPRRI